MRSSLLLDARAGVLAVVMTGMALPSVRWRRLGVALAAFAGSLGAYEFAQSLFHARPPVRVDLLYASLAIVATVASRGRWQLFEDPAERTRGADLLDQGGTERLRNVVGFAGMAVYLLVEFTIYGTIE